MSTESSPLPRAHKKAAEAEGYTSLDQHVQAKAAHEEASVLFAEAERLVKDEGAKRALRALKAHQDRLALDSSRRVMTPSMSPSLSSVSSRSAALSFPFPSSPVMPRAQQGGRSSVGENGNSLPNTPPFAIVSPSPAGLVGRTGLMRQASERAAIQRHLEFSKISLGGSVMANTSASTSGSGFKEESDSISGSPTTGSYMVLKDQKADPFQRFWNVVEGMLQEFSNPAVAFASAPLGSIIDPSTGRLSTPLSSSLPYPSLPSTQPDGSGGNSRSNGKSTRKKVSRSASSSRSSQDSFCLLPEVDHSSYPHTNGKGKEKSNEKTKIKIEDRTPSPKTREELILENESLRLSLDALASHAYGLQQQQQQHQEQQQQQQICEQERKKDSFGSAMNNLGIRSGYLHQSISPIHMTRLRKEVEKVWRDEEERVMEASRLIGGTESLPADQQRIRELERQVLQLRMENERQRTSLAKFRERFDQIKAETRKKRELAGKTGG